MIESIYCDYCGGCGEEDCCKGCYYCTGTSMNILQVLRERGLLKYMNIESMKQMIMQKEDQILSIMEEIDTLEQIVQEMESPCEKNES